MPSSVSSRSSSPSANDSGSESVRSEFLNGHQRDSQQTDKDRVTDGTTVDSQYQSPEQGSPLPDSQDGDQEGIQHDENKIIAKGQFGAEACMRYILKAYEKSPYTGWGDLHTKQSYRTLCRSRLIRRGLIRRQFDRGRGNPSTSWCNQKQCIYEAVIFTNPFLYLTNHPTSLEGLHADVYLQDFADAMVSKLFVIKDSKAKKLKALELLSFVDSPPVRVAFLQFVDWYELLGFKLSDQDFHNALIKTRPAFLELMYGVKTAAKFEETHSYIVPGAEVLATWTPNQLILRFLIWCEVWRQQKTPRSELWNIGSNEIVAHFLTAVLLNYKMMWREDCLGRLASFLKKYDPEAFRRSLA
ncbi:histone-lysine n-methyltransferase H3 lysine-9 specific dim-5 [Fusarium beomiforme]|uniref:Histone-lysine n-methyltransferase H3 lysine-9 specific dim-5 n=1 Tax=Fusarium beomiforme TaxID=44412 RepID=A0A9P5ASV9_9HYPO|nr:histone-lysine n-methyltransferase H3 lysine-9 specific dim-5 [Fusarium beomiforme]